MTRICLFFALVLITWPSVAAVYLDCLKNNGKPFAKITVDENLSTIVHSDAEGVSRVQGTFQQDVIAYRVVFINSGAHLAYWDYWIDRTNLKIVYQMTHTDDGRIINEREDGTRPLYGGQCTISEPANRKI